MDSPEYFPLPPGGSEAGTVPAYSGFLVESYRAGDEQCGECGGFVEGDGIWDFRKICGVRESVLLEPSSQVVTSD